MSHRNEEKNIRIVETAQRWASVPLILGFTNLVACALVGFGQSYFGWLGFSVTAWIGSLVSSSSFYGPILIGVGTVILAVMFLLSYFAAKGHWVTLLISLLLLLADGIVIPFSFQGGDIVPYAFAGILHLVCVGLHVVAIIFNRRWAKALR